MPHHTLRQRQPPPSFFDQKDNTEPGVWRSTRQFSFVAGKRGFVSFESVDKCNSFIFTNLTGQRRRHPFFLQGNAPRNCLILVLFRVRFCR